MDESHRRGNALSSQLCGTFSALTGGTPELPTGSPRCFEVWALSSCALSSHPPDTLQYQAPTHAIAL